MYTPKRFRESNVAKLHSFVEQHSFATLVVANREISASHIPLLLDRDSGRFGHLSGHMARANDQWTEMDGGPCLAIFHGPHAYVSPTWYDEQNVVPTWNYVAVHAAGTIHLERDRERKYELLQESVVCYEEKAVEPWSMDQADPQFIDGLLDAIVAFRIEIEQLTGNWKLSQHHAPQRRKRVADRLRTEGRVAQVEIADLMDPPE